jgi:hypothetical protein
VKLTDQEIKDLVIEVSTDVMGCVGGDPMKAMRFIEDNALTDTIRYPDNAKKQFVLESIVLGASMEDAYVNFTPEEGFERAKVLVCFLSQFGIHI